MIEKERLIASLLSEPLYMVRSDLSKLLMANPLDINVSDNVQAKEGRPETPDYIKSLNPNLLEKGETKLGRYTKIREDGVAVMSLHGPVIKDLDWSLLYDIYGGYAQYIKVIDSTLVTKDLQSIKADPKIKGLVIDVNSPGGMVVGTPEMGDAIREVRAMKPTASSVSTLSASAGYWLSASTGYVIASPSARVGSVGVYMAMMDDSEYLERLGLKLEVIKSGKLKAIGLGPLTKEQRTFLQAGVIKMHEEFRVHVKDSMDSTEISDSLLEGQALVAKDVVGSLVNEVSTNPQQTAIELVKAFI